MSAEKMVDVLARRLDRRRALAKLATGAVGGLAALIGLPEAASAGPVDWRCCHLCNQNSGSCSGCSCIWCWGCLWGDGWWYSCCECYKATGDWCQTDGSCSMTKCSWGYRVGQGPAQ